MKDQLIVYILYFKGEFREHGQFTIARDSSVSIQFVVIAHQVPPENQGSRIEAQIYSISNNDILDKVQRKLKIEVRFSWNVSV